MQRGTEIALAVMAVMAAVGLAAAPHAQHAGALFAAQDDPAVLADLQLGDALRADRTLIARNIADALAAGDPELASSLVDLATTKDVALPDDLRARVATAVEVHDSAADVARRFATGLITGNAEDAVALSGTLAGDLFVFGDIRDVVREGTKLASGEDADRLVLGLAAAGIAITAATYASVGAAAPARAGLTLVKDARKIGRLGEGLASWAGRSVRGLVDGPALQQAAAGASIARPGAAISAVKAAFKTEKAGGLVTLAKDVGRVGEKSGARGALDALKVAEGPKDVARAARLAEAKGGQARAFLKILGRGALLLVAGAFNLSWWLFGAIVTLIGFVSAIKSATERTTQNVLDRRRMRRAQRAIEARIADLNAVPQPKSIPAPAGLAAQSWRV